MIRNFWLCLVAGFSVLLATPAAAERLTTRPLVDADWLKANLASENLVVLDLRDSAAGRTPYQEGHIPGAVSAPYSATGWHVTVNRLPGMLPPVAQLERVIGGLGISNASHVVLVSSGTNASDFGSATRVYWTFKVLGHDAVSILDGGIRAWKAGNGEISTNVVQPTPASFKASFRSDLVASLADVEKARAGDARLVDGRPAAQFEGKTKSPVVRAAGTIPGAVNIDGNTLYDAENAAFASRTATSQWMERAGLGARDKIITFCNTGYWASIAWFALSEVQGQESVRLYDGSLAEWTSDPERPVQPGS